MFNRPVEFVETAMRRRTDARHGRRRNGDRLANRRMTPQSPFMVVAPIVEERVNDLKALLTSMNDRPGMAKPDNSDRPVRRLRESPLRALRDPGRPDAAAISRRPARRFPTLPSCSRSSAIAMAPPTTCSPTWCGLRRRACVRSFRSARDFTSRLRSARLDDTSIRRPRPRTT